MNKLKNRDKVNMEELTRQLYELVVREKEREGVLMEDEKKEIYDSLREWLFREMEKEEEEMLMFYRQLFCK